MDFFDVARVDFNLLIIFVVEFLSSSIIFFDESSGGLGLALQNLVSLFIDFLVELVVLEFELSVVLLFLLID